MKSNKVMIHEYCAQHRRRGNCQRHFELLRILGGWIGYLIGRGWIVRRYGLPDDIEATPSEASDYLPQPKCARQTEDIMTHVLIVMSWLGAVNGAMISTQEFTSAERCEAARQTLIEYAKARGLDETLRSLCMQK